jgi:hypothetical protein
VRGGRSEREREGRGARRECEGRGAKKERSEKGEGDEKLVANLVEILIFLQYLVHSTPSSRNGIRYWVYSKK